jgi:L-ectoine synthase
LNRPGSFRVAPKSGRGQHPGGTGILYPGVFYAFDKHERHKYRLDSEVRAIAIFNPPLIGDEINDEEGGYARAEDYKAR